MGVGKILLGAGLAISLAGCMTIPNDMTVADYCANPKKANENVCRLKVEIDGTTTALADTNMRLSDAQKMANGAMIAAADAQASADAAQASANAAMARANDAFSKRDDIVCETRTVQKTDTGTCRPGYTLTSCQQTRFTYRSGGPSILREINDDVCRFNDRVLEMQVRCCGIKDSVPAPMDQVIVGNPVKQTKAAPKKETSPLRY
ncbi:MAG: hypothetical protein ACRBEQ_11770 [Hyphomonas sp.]